MNDDTELKEQLEYNRKLKKAVLDAMFREVDSFYIHCMPNPLLVIGERGLIDKEKSEGIILAFGPYSTRTLDWDDRFIFCDMQFSRWENVTIPFECIYRIQDSTGQVVMQWKTLVDPEAEKKEQPPPELKLKTPGNRENKENRAPVKKGVGVFRKKEKDGDNLTDDMETDGAPEDAERPAPGESRVIKVDFKKKKTRE